MTRARSSIVDPSAAGFYHRVSRCVPRASLCRRDPYSKQSFEHRRQWVEGRLLELGEGFAVALQAYAVMSNPGQVLQVNAVWLMQPRDDEVADCAS